MTYTGALVQRYAPPTYSTLTAINVNITLEIFNDYLIDQPDYKGRLLTATDVFRRVYDAMEHMNCTIEEAARYVRETTERFIEKKRRECKVE